MSEQSNTENVKENPKTSKNPEIDTAGIYDISNPFFKNFLALNRISVHLHEVNEILESMDNELFEYRNCVKNKLLQKTETCDDPEIILWWKSEVQKEMKIFYYKTSYCLKILCDNFCVKDKHECYVRL